MSTAYPQIPYGWADARCTSTRPASCTSWNGSDGYADIRLEPHLQRYPGMRHGYVIELKYLKRSEPTSEARVAAAARQAVKQLQRYVADERLARQYPSVRFTGLAVVFHGWQLLHAEAT